MRRFSQIQSLLSLKIFLSEINVLKLHVFLKFPAQAVLWCFICSFWNWRIFRFASTDLDLIRRLFQGSRFELHQRTTDLCLLFARIAVRTFTCRAPLPLSVALSRDSSHATRHRHDWIIPKFLRYSTCKTGHYLLRLLQPLALPEDAFGLWRPVVFLHGGVVIWFFVLLWKWLHKQTHWYITKTIKISI